ncbi:2233_t:CDS:2, partial [Dentiscutata heterogama]
NVDDDFQLIENVTNDETIPIEFPATSNEGVAYNFNIQYSMEGGGSSSKINCPYLNCYVKKVVRRCTSVKVCEYTDNEIKNSSHYEVDKNKDFFIMNQPSETQTSIEAQTYVNCSEYPIICQLGRKSVNDLVTKFIGCLKCKPHEKHIFHILNKNQIDINLFEKLFQGKEIK